jgi:hypothetical protein
LGSRDTSCRSRRAAGICGMRVVASHELVNKVKYRSRDSLWTFDVHFFFFCRAPISVRQDCGKSAALRCWETAIYSVRRSPILARLI